MLRLLRSARRLVLAVALATTSAGAVLVACSDGKPTAVPSLELTYAPNPPVAGDRIQVTLTGKNLGAVDLFQGDELLARIVNPLVNDVPDDFFVFIAKNSEVPRAVVFDGDGNRVEVTGKPAFGKGPGSNDAGNTFDSGQPIVDAGQDAPPEYGETCPGVAAVDPDSGRPACGPQTVLGFVSIKNGRAQDIRVQENYYAVSPVPNCVLRNAQTVKPGIVYNANVTDNASVFVYEADGGALIKQIRIEPGAAASNKPCKLLIGP